MTPERKFLCRLSLAWGMPQSEIESTVSARDLDEMRDYFAVEPWGAWRDNVHAGLIASTICNVNRGKDTEPFTYEDFMLLDPVEAEKKLAKQRREKARKLFNTLKSSAKHVKKK